MATKFSAFDAAEYLDNDEAIAAYLNEVMEEGDSDLFLSALSDIARARSMSKVAEDSGLGRESIYKALRPGAKPGFVTISKIMGALGVRVVAQPLKAKSRGTVNAVKVTAKPRQAKQRARV
ncbi:MAG: addiction module antidote protein [Rhodanobacter sp.]